MPTLARPNLAEIPRRYIFAAIVMLLLLCTSVEAWAHNVAEGDKGYIHEMSGVQILPYIYLGAKHMVTGYDHLLFLFGVLTGISANAYLIGAIIGLSVVYKSLDNLGAFQRWFGVQPNTKATTLVFGFFHGFGLATKILEFQIPGGPDRRWAGDDHLAYARCLHRNQARRLNA